MNKEFYLVYDGHRMTPMIQKLQDLKNAFSTYNRVTPDPVEPQIIFAYGLNAFLKDAIRTLETNLNNIRQNNCRDAIPRNIKEMTKLAYWLEDDNRLEQEMYAFAEKPLSSYDLDFIPKHKDTIELYKAIVELIKRMIGLLLEMDVAVKAADETELYLSLYRNLRAQYCEDQAVSDFEELMSNSGKIDFYKMKTLQMQVIANFINGGTLNCAPPTIDLERENMTFDKEKSFMPHEYQYKQWFLDGWAVLNRSISWHGDIVVPDYSCVGLFISQRWEQLTERNLQDIFYLDKILDLIHKKMVEIAPAPERGGKMEDYTGGQERCVNEDTPLSALFREEYHEELRNIIDSWRPHLKDVDPDVDALSLNTFHFDLDQIQPSTVYLDFARLISQGALMAPMSSLAAYMFNHSNLSISENALYVQLKRYKKMCEQTRKKCKKRK